MANCDDLLPYNFKNGNHNMAVLVCYSSCSGRKRESKGKSRDGWKEDVKNLSTTFERFGFKVKEVIDKSSEELRNELKLVAETDCKYSDCLVLVLCSHGNQDLDNDLDIWLLTSDGKVLVSDLLNIFHKCEDLKGKPKLVFIQSCRVVPNSPAADIPKEKCIEFKEMMTKLSRLSMDDQCLGPSAPNDVTCDAVPTPPEEKSPEEEPSGEEPPNYEAQGATGRLTESDDIYDALNINCPTNFMVMCAVNPEYQAYRDGQWGSWFIKALCQVLSASDGKSHLLQLLTEVNWTLAYEPQFETRLGFKQMSVIYSRLTDDLYLKPNPS